MANQEHLDILKQGVEAWNQWRKGREANLITWVDLDHADLTGAHLREADLHTAHLTGAHLTGAHLNGANLREARLTGAHLTGAHLTGAHLTGAHLTEAILSGADLSQANLSGANLRAAILSEANLSGADLGHANLSGADLRNADFTNADFTNANLSGADLSKAILSNANLSRAILSHADLINTNLREANLRETDLSGADLTSANLTGAILLRTNFTDATLMDCYVYGVSAWSVELKGSTQKNLVITDWDEPTITVDNLEVAQFIYLLLNNPKIRDVIDTIAKKAVLILGRFTPERKAVLDTLREALRTHGYLPILFDFDKPSSRDLTETISTLAHLARFVIADITDAKSIPQELSRIVPNLPSVPVQPLILTSQHEYGMFEHFTRYPWVLPVYRYADEASLLQSLQEKVIDPAVQKAKELEPR